LTFDNKIHSFTYRDYKYINFNDLKLLQLHLDARPVVAVVQIVHYVLVAHEKLLGILIDQTK